MSDRRPLATPTEVALYLRRTVGTLANWRCRGMGPRYVKAGTRVGYRWSDVEAWLTKQTRAAA
jgi:hypothetical protein